MSHSFPPPPNRTPWWKFKTVRDLMTDRGHYRAALGRYDQARAKHGFPPIKHKGWFARHKILSSIGGFFVFLSLIAQCNGKPATIAEPQPAATVTVTSTPAAPNSEAPTPAASPTGPTEAEQQAADEKRRADAAAKKAADEKKREAAKKKATEEKERRAEDKKRKAEDKKRKAVVAKKKKAAEKKKRQREQEEAEEEEVYYANCAAVRAAGKAPIRRGQPGYRAGLDRDSDGQGCGAD